MNDQLMEKWHTVLDRQIPVYLKKNDKSQKVVEINKEIINDFSFTLNLPTSPKNIEEIKIIRCWLEKISLCYFTEFNFLDSIFNPELIQLIFENEEIDKIKFNCQKCHYLCICEENVLMF
ncbi:hypothetical protein ACQ4LE_006423 [Meloidogyne hapla]